MKQGSPLRIRGEHRINQLVVTVRRFLSYLADADPGANPDHALLDPIFTGDDPKERGLANAVPANNTDPVPLRNMYARIIENV